MTRHHLSRQVLSASRVTEYHFDAKMCTLRLLFLLEVALGAGPCRNVGEFRRRLAATITIKSLPMRKVTNNQQSAR